MANISGQTLFLTTSPRTPEKMIPEISLLYRELNGKEWNQDTQSSFMDLLRKEQFFNGKGEKDPALSARDRINRAPKSLGFIKLQPKISLTPAGEALLTSPRKDEVFLRQLMKFQLPSPYHKPTERATHFNVKPYLEILRLIRTIGTLKFDELQIFGMQLTDWRKFETVVKKIELFRKKLTENEGSYRMFKANYLNKELTKIYEERIRTGQTKTRESNDKSLEKFLKTQGRNMRDYADSCFRYLRATGLVNVSHVGKSLSIIPERTKDVDYLLNTIDRTPGTFQTEDEYADYLGNAQSPTLLTDNKVELTNKIEKEFPTVEIDNNWDIEKLKDTLFSLLKKRKENTIEENVTQIKDYKQYDDIQNLFVQIEENKLYDAPLMLEWNMWRAMTMIDGGNIKANLNFDDFGKPLSTAQGNMADIVCDYGDFEVIVEVTMASGQKQYEMESEPVSRHLGKTKSTCGKPCYCLFIAPNINEACIAYFFGLHNISISYYGGKSVIVPLPLKYFKKMLEDSYRADYTPNPQHIKNFFEYSKHIAESGCNEMQWYENIKQKAMDWLK